MRCGKLMSKWQQHGSEEALNQLPPLINAYAFPAFWLVSKRNEISKNVYNMTVARLS